MPSCEKCWEDAGGDPDLYRRFLRRRKQTGDVCSPEQQAGEGASICPRCGRKTVHQHAGICMVPKCGLVEQSDGNP